MLLETKSALFLKEDIWNPYVLVHFKVNGDLDVQNEQNSLVLYILKVHKIID